MVATENIINIQYQEDKMNGAISLPILGPSVPVHTTDSVEAPHQNGGEIWNSLKSILKSKKWSL